MTGGELRRATLEERSPTVHTEYVMTTERQKSAARDQAWKRIKAAAKKYTPTALFVPLIIFFEASILVLDEVLKR